MVENNFFNQKSIHYKSKSGSSYFYTEKGVYRYSNHWGRVANCRWKIRGIEDYKNQNYYIGYANWSNFFPLSSSEKAFYLKYDSLTSETTIHKSNMFKNSSHFLMSLDLALKRIKEIKLLRKNYKWALYFEDVNLVENMLITRLINSDKPLEKLKRDLQKEVV